LLEEYRAAMTTAGLTNIVLKPKPEYIAVLASFKDPLYAQIAAALPAGSTVADYVTSLDITATKA